MTRGTTGRAIAFASALLTLIWLFLSGVAAAQEPQDCADFDTQEEAQAFYDEHEDDDPDDPDPFDLDTDGDGMACEGLPTSGGTTQASPGPSPTPRGDRELPQNGAGTAVMALSGLTLLEAGYGLQLAAKRLGVRRRSVPLFLMRKMIAAAQRGQDRIEVAEDMYLVHRSVLEGSPVLAPVLEPDDLSAETDDLSAPVSTSGAFDDEEAHGTEDGVEYEYIDDFGDVDGYAEPDDADVEDDAPMNGVSRPAGPTLYAALARPDVLRHDV